VVRFVRFEEFALQHVASAVLCIVGGGIAAQWLAWRLRLPAIVLLFAVGLIAGPGLQILQPSDFGPALRPLIGLAVAIVVFEGGLALDLRELRAAGEGVLRLTAVALPINAVLGTLAARALTGMGWGAAAGQRWFCRCCGTRGCTVGRHRF
jgi:NhaP-type Na+/H+ or K+/H+ antiporter